MASNTNQAEADYKRLQADILSTRSLLKKKDALDLEDMILGGLEGALVVGLAPSFNPEM